MSDYVLESSVPLPLARSQAAPPDVSLTRRAEGNPEPDVRWFHDFTNADGSLWLRAGTIEGGYLLHYPGLVAFHMLEPGREDGPYTVVVRGPADVTDRTVGHLFLAQVWPMLLSHWGRLTLHASAVAIEGQAVAFVGQSGWGKSTLAAWFSREGTPFLTDDLLVLDARDLDAEDVEAGTHEVRALPSYAEQRLWDDSAEALYGASTERAAVAHYTDKRSVNVEREGRRFHTEPLPLARIYALDEPGSSGDAARVAIVPCRLREAYVRLLDQTFRLDLTDRARMRREVEQLTGLVHAVPVRRLAYPRRYDALGAVRDAVLDDLRG